jgi:ribosomal protein S12 methylthiotransferase
MSEILCVNTASTTNMVNLVQPVKPTIAFSHLGCEKNRVDTEHMLGLLVQAGYQVDSNEELADYVIVNTCSFI